MYIELDAWEKERKEERKTETREENATLRPRGRLRLLFSIAVLSHREYDHERLRAIGS
jgi:hypothetical protein